MGWYFSHEPNIWQILRRHALVKMKLRRNLGGTAELRGFPLQFPFEWANPKRRELPTKGSDFGVSSLSRGQPAFLFFKMSRDVTPLTSVEP